MSMNMTEIDRVIADDLMQGDVIMVGATHLEVMHQVENEDGDSFFITVLCDDGEEYTFPWDERVTLYGEDRTE